jgi:hypothetical protein
MCYTFNVGASLVELAKKTRSCDQILWSEGVKTGEICGKTTKSSVQLITHVLGDHRL